jgi:hypothetical protein
MRFNRTNGVCPINSVTFAAMRAIIVSFSRHIHAGVSIQAVGVTVQRSGGNSRDSGAHQHRGWHQGGVSDIDA